MGGGGWGVGGDYQFMSDRGTSQGTTLISRIQHQMEQAIAFRDVNPQAPTHILVIPRKAITQLSETEDEDEQVS